MFPLKLGPNTVSVPGTANGAGVTWSLPPVTQRRAGGLNSKPAAVGPHAHTHRLHIHTYNTRTYALTTFFVILIITMMVMVVVTLAPSLSVSSVAATHHFLAPVPPPLLLTPHLSLCPADTSPSVGK